MERLFTRLLAFYGAKFADAFAGVDIATVRDVWAEELGGYSLDEMSRGVNACRSQKWPPTLPEFLAFCRPPITPEAAYYEAVQNLSLRERGGNPAYSHPAVYWCAVEVGAFDLRNTPSRVMAPRWAARFAHHMAAGAWERVPAPPLALPPVEGKAPNTLQAVALRDLLRGAREHMQKGLAKAAPATQSPPSKQEAA